MGREQSFQGVIDLITMQAMFFDGEDGEDIRREPIPAEFQEKATEARAHMLEQLSLYSDPLMEMLLEEKEPPVNDIRKIIRAATLAQQITPVMMGSAYKNKGVQEILDAVTYYLRI